MESQDLYDWTKPELIFDPGDEDNLDDGFYGFVPWRAGEMHLGILNVLHQVDNTLDMYLLYGRDGRNWTRLLDHRPFIPRGGEGSYDQFDAETPTQPLVVGNELWFYYGGMNVHHDWWIMPHDKRPDVPEAHDPRFSENGHHLCLATMRLDGYVSLDATVREGWVETKPIHSTGSHLFINGRVPVVTDSEKCFQSHIAKLGLVVESGYFRRQLNSVFSHLCTCRTVIHSFCG